MARESTRTKRAPSKHDAPSDEKPARRSRRESSKEEPEKPTRRSRSGTRAVEEVEVTRQPRSRRGAAKEAAEVPAFNPLAGIDDVLDDIEKNVGISEATLDPSEKRMSTGLLMQDIVLGGGITAGWYTNFGQEQTCKTTDAISVLASSLGYPVPIRVFFDYEGSGEPVYIENIMDTGGHKKKVTEVFGVRDDKTGKYVVKPLIRYRTESTAEPFFDWLSQLLRKLPDKKKLGGQWYYIYEYKDRNTGKVNKENVKIVGNLYDKEYFKKTGMFRIPAPDGSLQALVVVDSYPAMLPGVQDVDDPNDALAEQARMFSKQLRRVKGRMKGKRVAVIGINILREVPMAMYGPSEKEACGTALKQFSDVRVRHTSRALSAVPYLTTEMKKDAKGPVMTERSVTVKGGKDKYRFINIRADKNKLSRPYMEAWLRLWISDGEMKARGFDPVWDTFCLTGDSLVSTNVGLRRIDSLENFEGIKVVSNDGKLHPITAWKKQGIKRVYEVEVKQGLSLKMTGDHRVYVLTSAGEFEWKRLDKVDPSNEVLLIKLGMPFSRKRVEIENPYKPIVQGRGKNQFGNRLPKKIVLTEDMAYLMGYLTSDGNLGSDKKSIHFYTSDNESRKKLESLIERVFNQYPCVYSSIPGFAKKLAYSIRLHSVEVFQALIALGMSTARSRHKEIPWSIFQSPRAVAVSFLRGLYAGDGSIGEGDSTCYSSYSAALIKQVTLLQWAMGIPTNKGVNQGYSAKLLKEALGWVKPEIKRGATSVGISKAHGEKLPISGRYGYNLTFNTVLSGKNGGSEYKHVVKALQKAGLQCARIKSIEKAGREQTYDITVDESENFIANGLVVHNCYLKETGQLTGKPTKCTVKFEGRDPTKSMGWLTFKTWVLGSNSQKREVCEELGIKPFDIRKACFKQMDNGRGIELFNANLIDGAKDESEDGPEAIASDDV